VIAAIAASRSGETSLRWGHALKQALDAATANIPELPGRTLILIDTSASMGQPLSRRSAMTMVQAAALFGLATGIRNRDRADVYGFADGQFRVERSAYRRSVLKSVEAFTRRIGEVGHGTRIAEAVRAMPAGHANRHELGGLTDATFALVPNIEAGLAARWPWNEGAAGYSDQRKDEGQHHRRCGPP